MSMENTIFVKEDLFKEDYLERATVLDKLVSTDADYTMYQQPDEYWISGAGKSAAWAIDFRFVENIVYPDDSLVNIFIGNTIIRNKSVRNFEGLCGIDFSPLPDPDNEGEILSQFLLVKEIIESQLPIYFEPASGITKKHIRTAGIAKFKQEDIDLITINSLDELDCFQTGLYSFTNGAIDVEYVGGGTKSIIAGMGSGVNDVRVLQILLGVDNKLYYRHGNDEIRSKLIPVISELSTSLTENETGKAADSTTISILKTAIDNLPSSITGAVTKSSGVPVVSTKGINLFNINDLRNENGKYLHTDGTLRSNVSYLTTHPIELSVAMHIMNSNTVNTPMCCFDSSDQLVQYNNASELTIPANTSYIKWSLDVAKLATAKIEIGTIRTGYSAYTELYNKTIPFSNVSGLLPLFLQNRVSLPSKLYLLGGNQNTLYHRAILERWIPNFDQLRIENSATAFINNLGYSRITNPVADASVDANLYNLNFAELELKDAKNFAIVVGSATTNNGAINHLCIGDSYTYDGNFLKQIRTICPALTNIGMRKPTNDATSLCEGRGGWSMANYFGGGVTDICGTTTESHTPFMHPAVGRYFGNIGFWKLYANNASPAGYGVAGFRSLADSIGFDNNGYKTNPIEDDIMYDNIAASYIQWNGTAWVNIATPAFTFDFGKYRSTWGIAVPNFVSILLGLNDFRNLAISIISGSGVTSYTSFKARMDALITSVHTDNSTAKIIIGLPQSDCGQEVNTTGTFVKKQNAAMWEVRRRLIADYENREVELIYIADTGSAVDPDFGWDMTTEAPFSTYGGASVRNIQTGEPHPSQYAYKEIGNRFSAVIQANR